MTGFWNGEYREQACWAETAERLIALAEFSPGAKVLDVGTGDGGTLFRVLERLGPDAHAVSIDIEGKWVDWTRREAATRGIRNADVLEMDARAMEFTDASYDVAILGLVGLDDEYDFERRRPLGGASIVREVVRVLVPGGTAYLSGWLWQEDSEWMGELVRRFLPGCTKRGYAPSTESGYIDILSRAGFESIRTAKLEGRSTFEHPAEWMATLRSIWEPEISRICVQPGAQKAFEDAARTLLAGHLDTEGRIAYARPAICLAARKPVSH
jgi:SAM-dependent methyltransferase